MAKCFCCTRWLKLSTSQELLITDPRGPYPLTLSLPFFFRQDMTRKRDKIRPDTVAYPKIACALGVWATQGDSGLFEALLGGALRILNLISFCVLTFSSGPQKPKQLMS